MTVTRLPVQENCRDRAPVITCLTPGEAATSLRFPLTYSELLQAGTAERRLSLHHGAHQAAGSEGDGANIRLLLL